MTLNDALQGVHSLFLDTAPVIYFVEQNPVYARRVNDIFDRIDAGALQAVTSPITLAEALVYPHRFGLTQLQQDFADVIVSGHNTRFHALGQQEAQQAAALRAFYSLSLTDALQVAVALSAGCEAFLTNDLGLKRVTALRVIVLDEVNG